jgi:hypothetical protein
VSLALRSMALYVTEPAAPAASARGPQIIWIMALLLCVGGSLDLALFLVGF